MKPSEKFKKRYISFALSVDGKPLPFGAAKECIHQYFIGFFGELGISELAFKLIKYSDRNGKGILRCSREKIEETIFCMACMHKWQGKKCRLQPLSLSGTIKRV